MVLIAISSIIHMAGIPAAVLFVVIPRYVFPIAPKIRRAPKLSEVPPDDSLWWL